MLLLEKEEMEIIVDILKPETRKTIIKLRKHFYTATVELNNAWRILKDGSKLRKEIADVIVDLEQSILLIDKELNNDPH